MARTDARADWEARVGRRRTSERAARRSLPPPAGLEVEAGSAHVTLRWEGVAGAAGYIVHGAPSPAGPFEPIDHGGGDVLAVPGPPYTDTRGTAGEERWYAVSTLAAIEDEGAELSDPVGASPSTAPASPISAHVRAGQSHARLNRLWRMLGSEHLSQLLYTEETGGVVIGPDFTTALRLARGELGADRVRAHAVLHDELRVYYEENGEPRYDFSGVDRVYDALLETGLRPVVELSFMPHDLARDPDATVFEYRGIISPPKDWDRWAELNRLLAEHLVERYGIEEVARWGFEVWNEANLEVFWSGTRDEYFRLYEVAVRAIKSVDERLLVGGPSTAAAGWIVDFLDFVQEHGIPLDFFSTHTYGNFPLDVRPALAARGLEHVEVWWTEWGVSPRHFAEVTDSAFGAPFVLHGMKRAQASADALAYWVVSDHFEELGRPQSLLHGGFGLLTVGNLRKPRYWALALAESLADELVDLALEGDGAGGLVDGWASRHGNGTVDVLLWNGTLDHSKVAGDPLLDRAIRLRVEGLAGRSYRADLARVDRAHSSVADRRVGENGWPAPEEWARLHSEDRLDVEDLGERGPDAGVLTFEYPLPMPGVARLRLTPR